MMTNKEFIKLLSGFPMKCEVEILMPDGTFVKTIELKKLFIAENDTNKAKNIIQIIPNLKKDQP